MNRPSPLKVEDWIPDASQAASVDTEIDMLADVLHAVVHAGASVSFFTPFSIDEARAFWVEKVLPGVWTGTRRVLVARVDDNASSGCEGAGEKQDAPVEGNYQTISNRIIGTVQLELDMPPNQEHRAGVAKLLVHPLARRRGVAKALMIALEAIALSEGRTLLTLDTVTGSNAELLYRSLGYVVVGIIPRYARGALTPELESTTVMYKELVR